MNEIFSQGGKGSTGILTNKQAVACHFGVKQSEVVYFSVGAPLTGYKVIYDKESQRAYSLPADIGSGVTAVSLSPAGVLVHSAGNVDLGALAVAREEYVTLPGSFTTGQTITTKNQVLVHTDGLYRWNGDLPKTIPANSTPDGTGGISDTTWVAVGNKNVFDSLTSNDGFKYIGKASDIEALRNIEPLVDGQQIILAEHTPNTKKGGGYFYYDASDTSSSDNNGTIVITTGGKRWKRITNGATCNPIWFGALGNGTTDDSNAFNAALSASNKVTVPWTPDGYVVSNINIDTSKRIVGEGRVKLKSTGNSIFNVIAFGLFTPCEISGFHFDMEGAPSTSVAIVLKTSLNTVFNARISDVTFSNCYGAIHDEVPKDSTTWTHDLEVKNMYCMFTKGTQIHLRQSNGFILFDSVKIDNTHNTSQITWSSALFENIAGLELTRFDVLGCGTTTPTYDATQFAIRIIGSPGLNASVWLNRVLVDYTRGLGIYIANVYNVVSDQLGVHLTLGESITLDTVTFSRFTNTSVFGARTNANAPAYAAGLRLNNCTDNLFTNTMVKDTTGHGIVVKDSVRNVFNNITSTNNVANGYAEDGVCDLNIKNGCYFYGNSGNSMNQIGAGSATLNMIKTNGQFVASTLGTASVA